MKKNTRKFSVDFTETKTSFAFTIVELIEATKKTTVWNNGRATRKSMPTTKIGKITETSTEVPEDFDVDVLYSLDPFATFEEAQQYIDSI